MDFGTDRILVTGAAGWLGRRLVDTLANGLPDDDRLREPKGSLRIRCLILPGEDRAALDRLSDRIEVIEGDIRNITDCEQFCEGGRGALLFHSAGIVHPRRVREFYRINVDGTKNILDSAIRAGVRRAVIISSNSPCGCNPSRNHRFDENAPYHPYMNYGRSKMLMELAVKEVRQAGKIETVIIRPPWFYGPYQPPRQTLFFKMIKDGKAPIVGDGNNLRSMAFIDNLCQGLVLAAASNRADGQTYWIADERPYTMNEIIDTVERLLEKEFKIPCVHKRLRLPDFASKVAWLTDKALQACGLYSQKIHVLSEMNKTIACDVRRALHEIEYRPHVALEEGMRRSIQSVLTQL